MNADSKNKKAIKDLFFYFTVPPTVQKWLEKKLRTKKSSDRGLIYFDAVSFISAVFSISFSKSITAILNEVNFKGNENVTDSGSKLLFEHLDMIQESNVEVHINKLTCDENQLSEYQNVSSIFAFKLYAAMGSNIAVTI